MILKKKIGLRALGKRGACYPHGYDARQLYDTFLVVKARQLHLYSTFHKQSRLKVLHIETVIQ